MFYEAHSINGTRLTPDSRQQLLQQIHVDVDGIRLGTLGLEGQQRADVEPDGRRVVLHVCQACRHGRDAGAVGQAHPQVQHDLGRRGTVRALQKMKKEVEANSSNVTASNIYLPKCRWVERNSKGSRSVLSWSLDPLSRLIKKKK